MLDVDAAVGTCQLRPVLLEVQEPGAEALHAVSQACPGCGGAAVQCCQVPGASSYRVAVRVAACYCVWLVEQAVADLAREVRAQAVELGLQRLQLLCGVSSPLCRAAAGVQMQRRRPGAHLVCPRRPRLVVAHGRHLLLQAVAARRPRWPVRAGLCLDEPGGGAAGGGRAPARRP